MIAIIYKITNHALLHPKSYIGFTTQDIAVRWKQHLIAAKRRNHLLSNAIKKYGRSAFTSEILYTSENAEHTLNVMEPKFIKEHNTHFLDGYGYNMTYGGEGYRHKCSDAMKAKLRAYWTPTRRHQRSIERQGSLPWNKGCGTYVEGNKNPMYGKHHNESSKKKMSTAKMGSTSPRKGVTLSAETKEKLRQAALNHWKKFRAM